MRCLNCGGKFENHNGSLKIENSIIGPFSIYDIEFEKCNECNKIRYTATTAKIIEERREKILAVKIGKLPVAEFIPAIEAANLLGISKQAFNKHRRVKKGFIYSFEFNDGRRMYHKKSVELFKQTGDGRFSLINHHQVITIQYHQTSKYMPNNSIWNKQHLSTSGKTIPLFQSMNYKSTGQWEPGKLRPRLN